MLRTSISVIICIGLLIAFPVCIFAEDCWVAHLKLTVSGKMEKHYKGDKAYHEETHGIDAKAQVVFGVQNNLVHIISKDINGHLSHILTAGDKCEHRHTKTDGVLTEGTIGSSKKKTFYWKYRSSIEYKDLCSRCSKELKKGPVEHSWEEEDSRFKYFINPTMTILERLCQSVQANPKTGYCNRTAKGFSGHMKSGGKTLNARPEKQMGESSYTGWPPEEVYEWNARKVPCKCSAEITYIKGDATFNGVSIKEGTTINLDSALIETVGRSEIKIKTKDGIHIHVGGHSIVDLSGLCKEMPEEPYTIGVIRGAFYYMVTQLAGKRRTEIHTGWIGVRGRLEQGRIHLASAGHVTLDLPMVAQKTGKADMKPEFDIGSADIKNSKVVLYHNYNPDERYLFVQVIKGRVKFRDASGVEKIVKEGEKVYKTWPQDAQPQSFKTVVIID